MSARPRFPATLMKPAPVLVVFRTFPEGDVIALAPETYANASGRCMSYMHVGQHDDVNYADVLRMTRPSTAAEIAPLRRELESIGYTVNARKRYTHKEPTR